VDYYVTRQWLQLYSPYLFSPLLLWVAILASFLNIAPSKMVGEVHVRRLFFHHYVYGFLMMSSSTFSMAYLLPGSPTALFTPALIEGGPSAQGLIFSVELFFLYVGLALFLDDVQDVPLKLSQVLRKLKERTRRSGKILQSVHLGSSLVTLYISLAVSLWLIENSLIGQELLNLLSHLIFELSLVINGVWGLSATKNKVWVRLQPDHEDR